MPNVLCAARDTGTVVVSEFVNMESLRKDSANRLWPVKEGSRGDDVDPFFFEGVCVDKEVVSCYKVGDEVVKGNIVKCIFG